MSMKRLAELFCFDTTSRRRGLVALSMIALLGLTAPSPALDIILDYNNGASVEPGIDPTGALLTNLFEHAESFYEDVFEDAHTLTIHYWYEDLTAPNIGVHTLLAEGGSPHRETEANIRIDNLIGWFIDTTPENNDEFNMQQTLWRDLSGAQQSDLYNNFGASIPETFEAGFTGAATAGAAMGVTDMLSVVMHEVGHALGMSAANDATQAQTLDNDYDFNPAFVFGQSLAAEVADGGNIAHLDGSGPALMNPSIGQSLRRLPSHTDLFSMASGHQYVNLDVPRREFYGGNDWNTDSNWSGDLRPGSLDDVYVRDPGSVVTANLSGSGFAANLFISEGGNVDAESFKLDVGDTISVDGFNTDLFIRAGGEAEAATLEMSDQGEVRPSGGLIDVNTLIVGETTLLIGSGTVDVQTKLRNNNGTIQTSGGTLTLTTTGSAVWDFDGIEGGDGIVNVTGGNMNVTGTENDAFDGTMTVSGGNTFNWTNGWTLNSGGQVILDDGTIAGGTWQTEGTIDVDSNSTISANLVLDGTAINVADPAILNVTGSATINGATINTGPASASTAPTSVVDFEGFTTYAGADINLNGVVRQNGNAAVTEDTTINGGNYDMDGGGAATWTLTNDLTMNVDTIESVTGNSRFDGTLNINNSGSTLTVNTSAPWEMNGTTNINTGTNLTFPSIAGQDFEMSGVTNIDGGTRFDAIVNITGTINFLDNTSRLNLNGGTLPEVNRIEGGVVNGPAGSTLRSTTASGLHGFGTINSDVDFLSDTELMADDGTLQINGSFVDLGTIGTADADGVLQVTNAWNTGLATELQMNGGVVTGAAITNDGQTRGFGVITAAGFNNNGTTSADGGTLTIDTATFPDLDGSGEAGVLNAVNGSIRVPGNFGGGYAFNGTINIAAPHALRAFQTDLVNLGSINMNGGSLDLLGLQQRSTMTTAGPTSDVVVGAAGLNFTNASVNQLNGNLRIFGAATIQAAATFNGPADLVVAGGSRLAIQTGANVGVRVVNQGKMAVGLSPGQANVDGFTQTASGIYEMEIDGLTAGTQYDQLIVANQANLAGALDVAVNANGGTYSDPAVRGTVDEFVMIIADSVAGQFDDFIYDGNLLVQTFGGTLDRYHIADGLFRILAYEPDNVSLLNYFALPGDANGDLTVDGQDFIIWNANKFTSGTDWLTGDFSGDGITDGQDFILWNQFKFTSADITSVVPEPGSGLLILLALCGLTLTRRIR